MTIINISPIQKELLERLESENQNFSFGWDEVRGILSFARSDALMRRESLQGHEGSAPEEAIVTKFLKQYGLLFGPEDIIRHLRLLRTKRDNIGWTIWDTNRSLQLKARKPKTVQLKYVHPNLLLTLIAMVA
jgi:hypothetical protein